MPGLGPELCLAFPRPWDCVSVTVALGVSSVLVSGLACGSGMRVPLWPTLPSTDTRVVSVALRVKVLRSTHNFFYRGNVGFGRARPSVARNGENNRGRERLRLA